VPSNKATTTWACARRARDSLPEPLGQPSLPNPFCRSSAFITGTTSTSASSAYISAITAGLINPPMWIFWRD
jgi:hypothetical protein